MTITKITKANSQTRLKIKVNEHKVIINETDLINQLKDLNLDYFNNTKLLIELHEQYIEWLNEELNEISSMADMRGWKNENHDKYELIKHHISETKKNI